MSLAPFDEVFAGRVEALAILAARGEWPLVDELLGRLDPDVRADVTEALAARGFVRPTEGDAP